MRYGTPEEKLEAQRRVEDFMTKELKTDRVVYQNELKDLFQRVIPHGGRFDSLGHLLHVECNKGLLIDTYFIRLEFRFQFTLDNSALQDMGVNVTVNNIHKGLDAKQVVTQMFDGYFTSMGRALGLLDTPQPQGIR